jgi:hypothetical protein
MVVRVLYGGPRGRWLRALRLARALSPGDTVSRLRGSEAVTYTAGYGVAELLVHRGPSDSAGPSQISE